MRLTALLFPLAMIAAGCSGDTAAPGDAPPAVQSPEAATVSERRHDEHSHAQPDKVRIADLALDLALDFDARQLAGTATYTLEWTDPAATQLVLDTRELAIEKVEADANGAWTPLQHALDAADPAFGSRLAIEVPQRNARVRVTYRTAPTASGLQWLEPSMTEGGVQPFMFSQSQAIHARSWVPLQDTPGVRFTYSAHVTSRPDVMVLMSADNDPAAPRDGDYSFRMPQPIPSYLLAIAAGDLVFKPISARSGVWAEPAMIDRAVAEFEDTEKMIATTEALYGPYRWERYDMLVLPPSFPFGGMENPRLTFLTPTVIVGDKSLVSLIAHELAHSWSGNLVTNASWKDIWLNEGFTTYVQGRITEALYGEEMAQMERQIDHDTLKDEMAGMRPQDQLLALAPLPGRDPDEALSEVPYAKGAWFLQFIEERVGRANFDAFLRSWFDDHAFQSVDGDQFVAYLKQNLLAAHPGAVRDEELEQWLNQPGVPATAPTARSRTFANVDTARIAWRGSAILPNAQVTSEWGTHAWVRFLESMGDTLRVEQLEQLDQAYGFTGTANGEIAMRWYPLAIRSGYPPAQEAAGAFIQRVGRRKLILPIYQALATTAEGRAFAREVFERARPGYHPITTASVQALLDKAAEPAPQAAAATAPAAATTGQPEP